MVSLHKPSSVVQTDKGNIEPEDLMPPVDRQRFLVASGGQLQQQVNTLEIGTSTAFQGVENVYKLVTPKGYLGHYNGRPVVDSGMYTGYNMGSGTKLHAHIDFSPDASLIEITDTITTLALAYKEKGYSIRGPQTGVANHFNPHASLEERKAWVKNVLDQHQPRARQAMDLFIAPIGKDVDVVAPIFIAGPRQGTMNVTAQPPSALDTGRWVVAGNVRYLHGDIDNRPAWNNVVHADVTAKINQDALLDAIQNGKVRPPQIGEPIPQLLLSRMTWLKGQHSDLLGSLPTVKGPNLNANEVKNVRSWRESLGLPPVSDNHLLGPDLLVAVNTLIANSEHKDRERFANKIPNVQPAQQIVAMIDNKLQRPLSPTIVEPLPVAQNYEKPIAASGSHALRKAEAEVYSRPIGSLESIVTGNMRPVSEIFQPTGFSMRELRSQLSSVASQLGINYPDNGGERFTYADSKGLGQIQATLKIPVTGYLDQLTATKILEQVKKL